jgi:SAM-dependent methyltransferase
MKRSQEKELMDLPDQARDILEEDLRNLKILNRWLGGSHAVLRGVGRAVRRYGLGKFSLLDIGTGSADIPAAIVGWARRRNLGAQIVGLEAEPVTAENALLETGHLPEISIVRGDANRPPFSSRSFDFVLASQLLHHFPEQKIVTNLKAWSALAHRAIIVTDLVRHPIAYYGIRCLTRLTTRNVMTLTDAPLSVKRAFTVAEWRDLFARAEIGRVELFTVFPFRMMALLWLKV